MATDDVTKLGQQAYEYMTKQQAHYGGEPEPTWGDLTPNTREVWEHCASWAHGAQLARADQSRMDEATRFHEAANRLQMRAIRVLYDEMTENPMVRRPGPTACEAAKMILDTPFAALLTVGLDYEMVEHLRAFVNRRETGEPPREDGAHPPDGVVG
jgi:hypothetical protein